MRRGRVRGAVQQRLQRRAQRGGDGRQPVAHGRHDADAAGPGLLYIDGQRTVHGRQAVAAADMTRDREPRLGRQRRPLRHAHGRGCAGLHQRCHQGRYVPIERVGLNGLALPNQQGVPRRGLRRHGQHGACQSARRVVRHQARAIQRVRHGTRIYGQHRHAPGHRLHQGYAKALMQARGDEHVGHGVVPQQRRIRDEARERDLIMQSELIHPLLDQGGIWLLRTANQEQAAGLVPLRAELRKRLDQRQLSLGRRDATDEQYGEHRAWRPRQRRLLQRRHVEQQGAGRGVEPRLPQIEHIVDTVRQRRRDGRAEALELRPAQRRILLVLRQPSQQMGRRDVVVQQHLGRRQRQDLIERIVAHRMPDDQHIIVMPRQRSHVMHDARHLRPG